MTSTTNISSRNPSEVEPRNSMGPTTQKVGQDPTNSLPPRPPSTASISKSGPRKPLQRKLGPSVPIRSSSLERPPVVNIGVGERYPPHPRSSSINSRGVPQRISGPQVDSSCSNGNYPKAEGKTPTNEISSFNPGVFDCVFHYKFYSSLFRFRIVL